MCKKSDSIKELAVALTKFNSEVSKIDKDAANPFFKNNYATLDHIIDEVRPILTKHGLSILQIPGGDGENVIMKTMLIHESGEWIESDPLIMKPVKNDPQAIGSCVTYARRYSLAAFLSLNTGEDDDGNGATHNTTTGADQKPQKSNEPKKDQPKQTINAKSAVMNLKNEMKWNWDTLGEFATGVLGRPIKKVITDIKTEDEWKKVEQAMIVTKQAS